MPLLPLLFKLKSIQELVQCAHELGGGRDIQ